MSRPGCFSCFTQHLGSNHFGHDISNERYFGLLVGTSISRGAKSSQSISKVYCPTTEQLPETSKRSLVPITCPVTYKMKDIFGSCTCECSIRAKASAQQLPERSVVGLLKKVSVVCSVSYSNCEIF